MSRTRALLARVLLTEPARPGPIRTLPRASWLAVATVCIGAFMGQLDASIVTVALPQLRIELGTRSARSSGSRWPICWC